MIDRAQGCLLGQLAGDALGSLVEFQSPDEIRRRYPDGVRELADGGTWNTIAGQPTDDSEMALLLARMLVKTGSYELEAARKEYQYLLSSDPFDCGMTISAGLRGNPNPDSQANGAMMRISPLGIFGAGFELNQVAEWAMQDAALTHPNLICQQANALFAMGIAHAIQFGCDGKDLYQHIRQWSLDMPAEPALLDTIDKAAEEPPADYVHQQGWVMIAFQNALYQLLHASSLEAGVVDTINRYQRGHLWGVIRRCVRSGRDSTPSGSTACKTAAQRPDIPEYATHARNASGRWMCWSWLKAWLRHEL